MTKKSGILVFIIFSSMIYGKTALCLYSDSAWQQHSSSLQKRLLKQPTFAEMDDACFIALLHRYPPAKNRTERTNTLFSYLKKYCRVSNTFSPSVLHEFLMVVDTASYPDISAGIAGLWKTYNGPLHLQLRTMERKGLYAEVDNVYSDFMKLSLLDVYELLKWARIKSILGDFDGAVSIYCKASATENSFVNVALNQLKRALADVSSTETIRRTLEHFSSCYRSHPGASLDTLSKWLSKTYAHFELFREEEQAITTFDSNPASKGERLLSAARNRFSRNLFSEALPPAKKAWQYLSSDRQRQKCAIICYQSYMHIGRTDSAVLWLDKVNLTQLHSKANAVVLYQNSGFFKKADSVIQMLDNTITRDTLMIRHYIFLGEPDKAQEYLTRCAIKSHWRYAPADLYLWHIRLQVYTGSLPQTSRYLDSLSRIKNSPSWHYTAEVLTIRLALQRLQIYPEAFKFWGSLRHDLYRNKPLEPVAAFNVTRWPAAIQEFLAATLIDALVGNEYYSEAQSILDRLPNLDSPQTAYFRGITSFMLGYGDKAKKIFEKIILSNPDDVFAHKARIYLLKLRLSQSM